MLQPFRSRNSEGRGGRFLHKLQRASVGIRHRRSRASTGAAATTCPSTAADTPGPGDAVVRPVGRLGIEVFRAGPSVRACLASASGVPSTSSRSSRSGTASMVRRGSARPSRTSGRSFVPMRWRRSGGGGGAAPPRAGRSPRAGRRPGRRRRGGRSRRRSRAWARHATRRRRQDRTVARDARAASLPLFGRTAEGQQSTGWTTAW